MSLAANLLAGFLILVCAVTALADLRRAPQVVESMTRLGVPLDKMPTLAAVKLLAVTGLGVGFFVDRVHVLVGVCLVLYFAVAVTAHVRVRDGIRHTAPAFVVLTVSVAFALSAIGS